MLLPRAVPRYFHRLTIEDLLSALAGTGRESRRFLSGRRSNLSVATDRLPVTAEPGRGLGPSRAGFWADIQQRPLPDCRQAGRLAMTLNSRRLESQDVLQVA